MRNSNSFSVLIWANKSKVDVNGMIPLYARVTVMGKRAEISLKKEGQSKEMECANRFPARKLRGESQD